MRMQILPSRSSKNTDCGPGAGLRQAGGPGRQPSHVIAKRRLIPRQLSAITLAVLTCSLAVSGQQAPAAPGQAAPPAQPGGGRGQQGPQVVSPEVNADRTVTLRLLAPKATEVTVTGELLNGAQPRPMTKGEDGVWTVTMPAVPPDVYTYAFNIDGVNTTDPRNPWVKLVASTGLASQVQIPGDGLQFWDSKPVPHGLLQIVTYESKAAGATRQAYVYTPPDYSRSNTRHPVLYLLHGGGDLDPGWSMTGRAHIIMDNLIAEKRARPMVVVMPLARLHGRMLQRRLLYTAVSRAKKLVVLLAEPRALERAVQGGGDRRRVSLLARRLCRSPIAAVKEMSA